MLFATSDNDAIIAVFALTFLFGGPIAAFLAWRYFSHRERLAMIKQGMIPPGPFGTPTPMPGLQTSSQRTVFVPNSMCQATLAKGIRTTFTGIALLIGLSFIGYHGDGHWTPGPWLLGGLVPFFVGLSQVVVAMLSGATVTVPQWQREPGPPEPPLYSVPNPPPGPPPSGPFTYRPPGDVPELPRQNPPRQI
jgi:hypothetical protein